MEKTLYRIALAFTVLGLLVSIYMTIYKLTDNHNMCLGNGGCSTVNSSVYAEVSGVPVAVIGIFGYAAILTLLLLEQKTLFLRNNGTILVFGLALVGFLFTLYLIFVELALIHALCPFCITSQIAMTIIFIVSVIRLFRQPTQ